MINVSKPHLPPLDEYVKYLAQIWGNTWITNHGPLVAQLEKKLEEYLGVKHVCFVSSGTMGLDIAIRAERGDARMKRLKRGVPLANNK